MLRLLPLALLVVLASACSREEQPHARLAPVDALTALLPDSVGRYGAVGDETYRGYYEDSTGALAVVTVERRYRTGAALATLSLSSVNDAARYAAAVESGGGLRVPDSLVVADSTLRIAQEAGWVVYAVAYGLVAMDGAGNAVEARSTFPGFAQDALHHVDFARFAAIPEEDVEIDETFLREVPAGPGTERDSTAADSTAPAPNPAPAPDSAAGQ